MQTTVRLWLGVKAWQSHKIKKNLNGYPNDREVSH